MAAIVQSCEKLYSEPEIIKQDTYIDWDNFPDGVYSFSINVNTYKPSYIIIESRNENDTDMSDSFCAITIYNVKDNIYTSINNHNDGIISTDEALLIWTHGNVAGATLTLTFSQETHSLDCKIQNEDSGYTFGTYYLKFYIF